MHRVCTAKILKPRQGKAFKIRAYHNYHEYHKYIYTYEKNKKRISENTITLFLIIIYIYLILGYYGCFWYYKPRNLDRARLYGVHPTHNMHTHTTNIGDFSGKKAGAAEFSWYY